ncbi:HpcH/HpaI aldolase/citrate lyase family protein [Yinghuangia soli]|uniref:CoA ester lyase n=1 Tax=Yinghuangia soli TaxID=2908204 RepID=A0AA41Q6C9_9ACTN|nr:CoA ester lyase [Yinghuangia soli]MCF2531516.1 CoA ester lyase [Yinghuangia soli]
MSAHPSSPPPPEPAPRSWLYVPGNRPEMLDKALGRGADAVIVDLEDAVPFAAKESARAYVATWLAARRPSDAVQIWVRINPGAAGHLDAAAVAAPALRGLCQAKCTGPDDVLALGAVLDRAEEQAGLPQGRIAVSPLLEDAGAVLAAPDVARAPRVVQLQLGEADLCAELGIEPGPDGTELLGIRTQVLLASAAAGIRPPVGPVATDYRDEEALRRSTEALRRLGYRSRACIHPAQLPTVHAVFTPSEARLDAARRLVERFDAAVAAGEAVLVGDDGRMVDEAVVRQARRVVAAGSRP